MMTLTAFHNIDDNLCLTEIRSSDKSSIVKHVNDLEIHRNTLHIPYPYYDKDADQFLELCKGFEEKFNHIAHYAIRSNGEMIGAIGFLYSHGENSHKAEIGYWIGKAYRNKGIASRAVQKLVEVGFGEKSLFRLEANVFINNNSSMRVLEKAGFTKIGLMKSTFIKGDKLVDTILYAIVKDV